MKDFDDSYFRKYYEGRSESRDSPGKFFRYLRIVRQFQPAGRLLEIGSGYGGFLRVASKYYRGTGIDISEHALLRTAQSYVDRQVNLVCASPEALPFSNPFDVVVSFDCLEHVPRLETALDEIGRLQDAGGTLIIVVPVYDTFIGGIVRRLDDDVTHVHKRSRYFWIEEVEKAGYEILSTRGAWRYLLMGRWYLNVTIPFWKISPALLIVARRSSDNKPRSQQ